MTKEKRKYLRTTFVYCVSVAPGIDFGKDFEKYLCVCVTGESPDRLEKGIDRLSKVLLNI